MLIAINRHIIDKALDALQTANGSYENVDITVQQLAAHVAQGHAFCAQHKNHWRKASNFTAAEFLAVDIDHGLTLDAATADDFVQRYASLLYTTPSHRETAHRFRLVFELEEPITDAAEMTAALTGLIARFGGDGSCKDACRMFFGSTGAQLAVLGHRLPVTEVRQLQLRAAEREVMTDAPSDDGTMRRSVKRSRIDLPPETLIKLASGTAVALRDIPTGIAIHCPMHVDMRPSALALRNRHGNPGIYCSTCSATFFMDDGMNMRSDEYDFNYSWRNVMEISFDEYETYSDHDGIVTLADVRGGLVRDLDAKFLPFDELGPATNDLVQTWVQKSRPGEDCKVTLVKSPKGTGKTKWLEKLVELRRSAGERVLLVGHRRALINATAQRIGLTSYLAESLDPDDASRSGLSTPPDDQYAICVDSLPRMAPSVHCYDVVLIDEVEQVLCHLVSRTLEKRRDALHTLRHYLRKAKAVYLLDADLGKITIDLLTAMLGDPPPSYQAIINRWKPENRVVQVYGGHQPHQLTGDLVAALQRGERCFVCSNSKRTIDQLFVALPKWVKRPLQSIAITRDNSQTSDIQEFLANVQHRALEFDVILASPAVGTGIDITFPNGEQKIDCVFGIFRDRINTHFDIDQQLCRVRNPGAVKVWISPLEFNFETDAEVIKAELGAAASEHLEFIGIDDDGMRRYNHDPLYDEVFAVVTAAQRASKNRLLHNFIELRKANGWTVEQIANDDKAATVGRKLSKAARDEIKRLESERMLTARAIDLEEYLSLRDKERQERIDDQDKPALRRHEIESFYREQLTSELLSFDDQGGMRERIRLFEIVRGSEEEARRQDFAARDRLHQDQPALVQKRAFVLQALEASGLMVDGQISRDATVDAGGLKKFADHVHKNKLFVEWAFDMNVRKDLVRNPVRQLQDVIKLIGWKLISYDRDQSGGTSKVLYQLDQERLTKLDEVIDRRAEHARSDAAEMRLVAGNRLYNDPLDRVKGDRA